MLPSFSRLAAHAARTSPHQLTHLAFAATATTSFSPTRRFGSLLRREKKPPREMKSDESGSKKEEKKQEIPNAEALLIRIHSDDKAEQGNNLLLDCITQLQEMLGESGLRVTVDESGDGEVLRDAETGKRDKTSVDVCHPNCLNYPLSKSKAGTTTTTTSGSGLKRSWSHRNMDQFYSYFIEHQHDRVRWSISPEIQRDLGLPVQSLIDFYSATAATATASDKQHSTDEKWQMITSEDCNYNYKQRHPVNNGSPLILTRTLSSLAKQQRERKQKLMIYCSDREELAVHDDEAAAAGKAEVRKSDWSRQEALRHTLHAFAPHRCLVSQVPLELSDEQFELLASATYMRALTKMRLTRMKMLNDTAMALRWGKHPLCVETALLAAHCFSAPAPGGSGRSEVASFCVCDPFVEFSVVFQSVACLLDYFHLDWLAQRQKQKQREGGDGDGDPLLTSFFGSLKWLEQTKKNKMAPIVGLPLLLDGRPESASPSHRALLRDVLTTSLADLADVQRLYTPHAAVCHQFTANLVALCLNGLAEMEVEAEAEGEGDGDGDGEEERLFLLCGNWQVLPFLVEHLTGGVAMEMLKTVTDDVVAKVDHLPNWPAPRGVPQNEVLRGLYDSLFAEVH